MPQEHHITVSRRARWYLEGDPATARDVWYALHGYGQLAAELLAGARALVEPERLVVAPEALSRFYLDRTPPPPGTTLPPKPPAPPAREDPPTAPWTSPPASPPAGSLNHIPNVLGIPADSVRSDAALEMVDDDIHAMRTEEHAKNRSR